MTLKLSCINVLTDKHMLGPRWVSHKKTTMYLKPSLWSLRPLQVRYRCTLNQRIKAAEASLSHSRVRLSPQDAGGCAAGFNWGLGLGSVWGYCCCCCCSCGTITTDSPSHILLMSTQTLFIIQGPNNQKNVSAFAATLKSLSDFSVVLSNKPTTLV